MNKFKEKLIKEYLIPQNKQWLRTLDSMSVAFCFLCTLVALYYLNFVIEPTKKLSYSLTIVSWVYLVTLVPIFFLYKESLLKKYERLAIVFFVLFSGSSLLFSILQLHINT